MVAGKRTFLFLIFASLMLCKVSALHVYDHGNADAETIEHCALCDLVIEIQQAEVAPFFDTGTNCLELPTDDRSAEELSAVTKLTPKQISYRLYGRPPPVQ